MPKQRAKNGEKNLIRSRLIQLRQEHGLSQRNLAKKMRAIGYRMDKNAIHRIETNQRYVSDIEVKAFCTIFQISYGDLLDGKKLPLEKQERKAKKQWQSLIPQPEKRI